MIVLTFWYIMFYHGDILISINNILGEITYNEFPTANGNAFVSF